ncbi:MAG: electron transfer flavoprotein subunit beta/FixA family protein [Syntrophomonadaceae bacterium]
MDIITCFKWVIDEAYIKVGPSRELDLGWVDYKLSDYDRNAIEEAMRLKDLDGGKVVAVTVGPPEATKGLKDALSRGPDEAIFINDPAFSDLEPSQTASILAEVIGSRLKYDLILCGEGSSDLYAQQVGPRVAELLGIPCISFVSRLEVKDRQVTAERKMEDGTEVVTAQLPALITVLPDINSPRIPGLKDTLAASKKPVTDITGEELKSIPESYLETREVAANTMERQCIKFNPDAAGIKGLVEALLKDGVIG